jgi:inner membrane protein
MDNLTHSMTATIAAKFVRKGGETPPARPLFWLLVLSVNFPDFDVVMALFRDPVLSIKTHRWITHSVLAAPFFAVIPAALFYRFSSIKDFRFLWLTALLGILLHIVCDLVTPYGTMLLAPFSNHRFTLSSLFIVDLYFSFGLIALILLARYDNARKKLWQRIGLIFLIAYLIGTFCIQTFANSRVRRAVSEKQIAFTKLSTLPLPLSVFDWVGLVQTETGVQRIFFSVFDDKLVFEDLLHSSGKLAAQARQHPQAQWYFSFAHHPWVKSFVQDKTQVVEIHDLQFSAPPRLIKMFGVERRRPPFTLRFTYNAAGELTGSTFNE